MKALLILLLVCCTQYVSAQLVFPKSFRCRAGENGAGYDDVYTNGKYSFITHKIFREYDYKGNDEGVRSYMTSFFGFPFGLTKDGLCWGTGKNGNFYSYVIVSWDAEVIELYSTTNDEGFSTYSKWLLATARQYRKEGRSIIFPTHKRPKEKR